MLKAAIFILRSAPVPSESSLGHRTACDTRYESCATQAPLARGEVAGMLPVEDTGDL